jgi:hypothetical protein
MVQRGAPPVTKSTRFQCGYQLVSTCTALPSPCGRTPRTPSPSSPPAPFARNPRQRSVTANALFGQRTSSATALFGQLTISATALFGKHLYRFGGVNDTEPCLVSCFAKCPFRAREGETLPRVLRRYQAFALPPGVRVQTCGSQWHPFRGGGVSEVTAGARPVTTSPSDTGVSSMGSDH